MGVVELFLLAVGLSMDAFAVSVCKGLSTQKLKWKHYLTIGLWFGGFQALMPLIGYFVGVQFRDQITAVDHWIAFGLLAVIGGRMVWGARDDSCETESGPVELTCRRLVMLAVATSIDALAVGVSMAFMKNVNIFSSALVIGVVAFGLSVVGGLAGRRLGCLFQKRAELVGGLVLIGIGLKILLEHLLG